MTGPRFLIRKACAAQVRFDASNTSSRNARLTMTVIRQKIALLAMVNKKMVLVEIRTFRYQSGVSSP